MNTHSGQKWCWKAALCVIGAAGVLAGSAVLLEMHETTRGIE
jgi:hypothetical protein